MFRNTITCRLYFPAIFSNLALSAANLGRLMCTDARIVVPKFVGQNVKNPRRSWCENGSLFSTSFTAVTSLLYTCENVQMFKHLLLCVWQKYRKQPLPSFLLVASIWALNDLPRYTTQGTSFSRCGIYHDRSASNAKH